ncbi:MAG: hypothetical protein U1E27_11125 [Kiritimatiellia bacterium]|nr:hypothetical protein [Kiritimatiellia bacterium]
MTVNGWHASFSPLCFGQTRLCGNTEIGHGKEEEGSNEIPDCQKDGSQTRLEEKRQDALPNKKNGKAGQESLRFERSKGCFNFGSTSKEKNVNCPESRKTSGFENCPSDAQTESSGFAWSPVDKHGDREDIEKAREISDAKPVGIVSQASAQSAGLHRG